MPKYHVGGGLTAALLLSVTLVPAMAQGATKYPSIAAPPAREQPSLTTAEQSRLKDDLAKARAGAKAKNSEAQQGRKSN